MSSFVSRVAAATGLLLLVVLALAPAGPVDARARKSAPRKAARPPAVAPNPEAEAEAWRALARLGPPHLQVLPRFVGRHKLETRFTPAGQNAAGPTGYGTAEAVSVLGGRAVRIDVRADVAGQPYEALLLLGFDNGRSRYTLALADTASTMRVDLEGTCELPCRTLVLTGRYPEPRAKSTRAVRATWRLADDGSSTLEVFDTRAGGDLIQSMVWAFTRE
jgi:pyruvate/2-oxoglutarate dehydrogenase complex dihydrolipoamide acyltransferase (E2) component